MPGRSKLTVRLPDESLEFLKRYAAAHGLTVTEVLSRYIERLQESMDRDGIHPRVDRVSGIVPPEADAEALYHEHALAKHR
jgi:hypothetical protein